MALSAGIAALAGGSSLLGGSSGSSGAKKAAKAQVEAAQIAADTQRDIFRDIVTLQGPQLQAGATATNRYLTLLGLEPAQASNAMAGGSPDAAAQLQWLQQNTGPKTQAMIRSYLAANAGKTPQELLSGILAAGLGPKDTAAFGDYSGDGSGIGIPRYNLSVDPNAADFGKYARDFSMEDFEADPGYAFRFDEGLKAMQRAMAAKGQFMSGSMIKGATRYGQDMASQEYTNAFNRYQINRANQLNPLEKLMGQGESSVNQLSNSAQNYGNNVSELQTQQGNARASGYVGAANSWNNALSGFSNNLMSGLLMGGF